MLCNIYIYIYPTSCKKIYVEAACESSIESMQKQTNGDLEIFLVDRREIKVTQGAELSNNGPQYMITQN